MTIQCGEFVLGANVDMNMKALGWTLRKFAHNAENLCSRQSHQSQQEDRELLSAETATTP
jgi:hypothetical protein